MQLTKEPAEPGNAEEVARFREHFPDGVSYHGFSYWNKGTGATAEQYERETLLEAVRRAHYPNLPSRFVSCFAWESLDVARELQSLKEPRDIEWKNALIWKVEAEQVFRADMNWLAPIFMLDPQTNALNYWEGRACPVPMWECVLPLPVTAVEQVE
jgi:Protein of unknown function (DUF2441)